MTLQARIDALAERARREYDQHDRYEPDVRSLHDALGLALTAYRAQRLLKDAAMINPHRACTGGGEVPCDSCETWLRLRAQAAVLLDEAER